MSRIVCVVPTIRPESHAAFVKAWTPLFERHQVTLITVWDGEAPEVTIDSRVHTGKELTELFPCEISDRGLRIIPPINREHHDLFCRRTDACRNLGFVAAAQLNPDYLLTLDDDCYPVPGVSGQSWQAKESHTNDPIEQHINALNQRASITWMNTATPNWVPFNEGHPLRTEYLRGVPYSVREEAPVMLSHGVWVGTPDFDGETQLRLENDAGKDYKSNGVPYSLPYYVGPVPRGVLMPICGMSVMVRREAIPYLYFAPMGQDTGIEGLNRFGDIWLGVLLKREFDMLGWAVYTGASTILHTRASDARKNFEQEKLGRKWNEWVTNRQYAVGPEEIEEFGRFQHYWHSHLDKRARFNQLITGILKEGK